MSEVPKFVRQKLARQPAGEHPDADMLAAFAEGALTGRERAQVVAHMSACAACRETVALALPEVPATGPAVAPTRTRWARWPMLRWAGVAAAVVVVAAAVVVKNAHRQASTAQFGIEPSAAQQTETKQPPAPMEKEHSAQIRQDRVAAGKSAASSAATKSWRAKAESTPQNQPEKKKDTGAVGGEIRSRATSVAQANEPARSLAATAPAPAAPAAKPETTLHRFEVAPGAAGVAATDQVKPPQVIAPLPPASSEAVEVFGKTEDVSAQQRAKAQARKSTAMNSVVGGPMPGPGMAMAVYSLGRPRWRISEEGAVERSLDAGQSWQRIAVAGARESFRSVAAVDNDVWAGGRRGALYHSSDSGRTWQAVPVKAGDVVLEADIARVEFSDAQHGIVTTTAGETWSTGDGGASWSATRR